MRYNFKVLLLSLVFAAAMFSCKKKPAATQQSRLASNQNKMVIDESFQPIVDEELYVFKAESDTLHPNVSYAPENKAIDMFLNDSVRIAILSRELNADETRVLRSRNAVPTVNRFAIDAIAVIVNEASTDTSYTLSELKNMLNGNTKKDKIIVFDNPNSSLVRYLKDFAGSKDLKQKNIYALKSNKDVINYVSTHPDAIGITGFAWLNDPDKDYAAAVEKVKIAGIKDDINKKAENQYFTPSQTTLALNQYPLSRNLYILYNTSRLAKDFEAFIMGDRGQRIIMKSGLLPNNIPGRHIVIEKKIKTKA